MAFANAKNGIAVATLTWGAGLAIAQSINALRAKAQSKGLADEIAPDLIRLQEQLDKSQSSIQTLQEQLKLMDESLTASNRAKLRWSMASFLPRVSTVLS